MDLAFLGAGVLGGIGFVASLVVAIVIDGRKADRSEKAIRPVPPARSPRHPR